MANIFTLKLHKVIKPLSGLVALGQQMNKVISENRRINNQNT